MPSSATAAPRSPGRRSSRPDGFVIRRDKCGPPCHHYLGRVQRHAGLSPDGVLGPQTMRLLQRYLPEDAIRQRMHRRMVWARRNQGAIHYAMSRPVPHHMSLPMTTDCSGMCIVIAERSGAPDPSGFGFNGAGNSGSMIAHCRHLRSPSALHPGDYVAWGGHVSMVYRRGSDPLLFSHGFEGGPIFILLSTERRYHSGQTYYLAAF